MIEKENNGPGTKISFSNNTIDQMSVLSNNETQRMADNNNNCRYCELSWINSFSRVQKKIYICFITGRIYSSECSSPQRESPKQTRGFNLLSEFSLTFVDGLINKSGGHTANKISANATVSIFKRRRDATMDNRI